tara:strand:- start:1873 stop:4371 length:2499 start_codon:yes stop_codon:yes gene_type:complete
MTLITNEVPNMVGGVSQQPDSMRLVNQCEAQENAVANPVEGLTKRPPTEHIKELLDSPNDNLFIHHVNRDSTEQYFIVCDGDTDANNIKVFDMAGVEKTITADTEGSSLATGQAYLTTTTPRTSLKAVTIADVTFLVNSEKTVAQSTTLSSFSRGLTSAPNEALIVVKRSPANFSKCKIDLKVNDTDTGLTSDGSSEDFGNGGTASAGIDAIATANRIVTALDGSTFPASTGSTLTAVHNETNVVFVTGTQDFSATISDGQGNEVVEVIKDKVRKFTDLPQIAVHGMIIEVEGDPEAEVDDYYCKFEADDPTITTKPSKGRWIETTSGGIKNEFDFSTLPHILIRQADGTFKFTAADGSFGGNTNDPPNMGQFKFQPRLVGDELTNPAPTFTDNTISDVSFFRNRLVFLSGENVIMSEVGEYFNFYRTTVAQILDSSVIDVAVGGTTVSNLKQAVPFAGRLVLFSDTSQFSLQGEPNLSPISVSITPQTGFEITATTKPVVSGSNLFFGIPRGDFNGVKQFFKVNELDVQFDAVEVTAQVPKYIKGNITKMAASTHENVLLAITDNDPGVMYAYYYFEAGGERRLSSWSKFTFGSNIYSIHFIDTTLFILFKRGTKLVLESMKMQTGLTDTGSDYVTRLDRRVSKTGTYDDATDKTTFTGFEYTPSTSSEVVTSDGLSLTVTDRAAGSVSVQGDFSSGSVFIGEPYTMRYEFSKPMLKAANFRNNQITTPSTRGNRHQLRYMTILFADTAFFEVKVTPEFGSSTSYTFTGRNLGDSSSTTDQIPRESGDFRVPVFAQSDRVKIELLNASHLPSDFQATQFEGEFTSRRAAQR